MSMLLYFASPVQSNCVCREYSKPTTLWSNLSEFIPKQCSKQTKCQKSKYRKLKGIKRVVINHDKKIGSGPSKKRVTDVKVINTVPPVLLQEIFVAVKVI